MVLQLQSSLVENQKIKAATESIEQTNEEACDMINDKLEEEGKYAVYLPEDVNHGARMQDLQDRCSRLAGEIGQLREVQLEMESELVGARLDNVYLDKVILIIFTWGTAL